MDLLNNHNPNISIYLLKYERTDIVIEDDGLIGQSQFHLLLFHSCIPNKYLMWLIQAEKGRVGQEEETRGRGGEPEEERYSAGKGETKIKHQE